VVGKTGGFKFDRCQLKHYVRVNGWLPNCRARKKAINQGVPEKKHRRLRYFTFCAIGAIDVLMLDVAKIVRPSSSGRFDTVVFFDRDGEAVIETQKRIPGAIGFTGKFTDVVLAGGSTGTTAEDNDVLAAPSNSPDTKETREHQRVQGQRNKFFECFPFDVINLDLEEYAFKPNDEFPGKVVRAMRNVFLWQQRPLEFGLGQRPNRYIDAFTLMFTTRIGPANMTEDYKAMLRECLKSNVTARPELLERLKERTGVDQVSALEQARFDEFFKLGIRKVLANLLLATDWYVEAARGIKTFEFVRQADYDSYTMLHFVMDVRRQQPVLEKRAPNSGHAAAALSDYTAVVDDLFGKPDFVVTDQIASSVVLRPSLEQIRARRRKYYPDDPD
jgi:hypothetical protein